MNKGKQMKDSYWEKEGENTWVQEPAGIMVLHLENILASFLLLWKTLPWKRKLKRGKCLFCLQLQVPIYLWPQVEAGTTEKLQKKHTEKKMYSNMCDPWTFQHHVLFEKNPDEKIHFKKARICSPFGG